MKLIKQEDECGCSLACIAMATGRSYAAVKKDFNNDFLTQGQPLVGMLDYLANSGFTVIRKQVYAFLEVDHVRKEMLKPFAPLHIVHLQHSFDFPHSHVVIMTKTGNILDPDDGRLQDLSGVYAITDVVGLYR